MALLRVIGVTLALGLLGATVAGGQQSATAPRIGLLGGAAPSSGLGFIEAFKQGLRDLGWVEGQNIVIEGRYAEGRLERYPDLVAERVRLKVDVIIAPAAVATRAAKKATRSIPIVMVVAFDPVGEGLVASLARPGGNITGLSSLAVDLAAKQLELLKAAVPKVSRVAVVRIPDSQGHTFMLKEIEVAARTLGVTLQVLDVRGPDDLDGAFAAMTRERAGALLVLPHPVFLIPRMRIAELAAKHRLPAMYALVEHVEAGGLMAYAPDLQNNWRRAAIYVDKILKGVKPADLPVEQPTKFDLVINLKTAKALDLTIPPSLLQRADKVLK